MMEIGAGTRERSITLLAAYRATTYRVDLPQRAIPVRIGQGSPDLDHWLRQSGATCAAFITADNPGSIPHDPGENRRRALAFHDLIAALGLAAIPQTALPDAPDWPPEPGHLVLGLTREAAIDLAERVGQNALVHYEAGGIACLVLTRLMCP